MYDNKRKLHRAVVDTLNKTYDHVDYRVSDCGWYIVREDSDRALGANAAKAALEEHGAVVVKTMLVEDHVRIWFRQVNTEEVVTLAP